MKALVTTEGGLEVVDRPDPEPGPGEVVVAVHSCGICGSDVHLVAQGRAPRGHILGHEFSGTVAAVGPGVEGWQPGDPVAVNPLGSCGRCRPCRLGVPIRCQARPNLGLNAPGAMAEKVAVPAAQLVRMPPGVDLEWGAQVEPLAVALRALHLARVEPEDDVLVFGVGPIGLRLILALRATGFGGRIVGVGRSPGRRAAARAAGADVVLDGRQVDVVDFARREGLAFTRVFECSGAPAALNACIHAAAVGGVLVLVGLTFEPIPVDTRELVRRSLRLEGSCAFDHSEYLEAHRLICSGRVDVRPLVSRRVSLQEAPDAFRSLEQPGQLVGILVQPWR